MEISSFFFLRVKGKIPLVWSPQLLFLVTSFPSPLVSFNRRHLFLFSVSKEFGSSPLPPNYKYAGWIIDLPCWLTHWLNGTDYLLVNHEQQVGEEVLINQPQYLKSLLTQILGYLFQLSHLLKHPHPLIHLHTSHFHQRTQ